MTRATSFPLRLLCWALSPRLPGPLRRPHSAGQCGLSAVWFSEGCSVLAGESEGVVLPQSGVQARNDFTLGAPGPGQTALPFSSQPPPPGPGPWAQLSPVPPPSDTRRGALSSPQGHRGAKQRL